MMPLSVERIERNGLYLLDDGSSDLYVWIGSLVSSDILKGIFGQPVLECISSGKVYNLAVTKDCSTYVCIFAYMEGRLCQ